MVKNYLQYLLSKVRSHSLLGFNMDRNDTEGSPPPEELIKIPNILAAENPGSCD